MGIESNIKAQIDALAARRLSDLSFDTPSFIIMSNISGFRHDLWNSNIIDDDSDPEEDEITHSAKLLMERDLYFQYGQEIARFVAYSFDVDHLYVTNKQTHDGIIFVGVPHNIYIASFIFKCITKIAALVHEKYLLRQKRYKNNETIKVRANDYMDEWLEELLDNDSYSTLYSRDNILYKKYIKKHFITYEDTRKVMLRALEMIKPIYEYDDKNDTLTWDEFKKEVFKTFPEKAIKKTAKQIGEWKSQDIVMLPSMEK